MLVALTGECSWPQLGNAHDPRWGMVVALDTNMDIDLATPVDSIGWLQDKCPWNEADQTIEHRCAVKDTSICPYFCGIEYLDNVLCCYPADNPLANRSNNLP